MHARRWNRLALNAQPLQEISNKPGERSIHARPGVASEAARLRRLALSIAAVVMIPLVILAGIAAMADADDLSMQESSNAALVRDDLLGSILFEGSTETAEGFVAADAEISAPGQEWIGPDGMRKFMAVLSAATAEQPLQVLNMEARGDLVEVTWSLEGASASEPLGLHPVHEHQILHGRLTAEVIDGQVQWLEFQPAM